MDKIIRATAADGMIKMAVITARDTVERARQMIPQGFCRNGLKHCRMSCVLWRMHRTGKISTGSVLWRENGSDWHWG